MTVLIHKNHLLVGPPASGKSTLAKRFAFMENTCVLSTDALRAVLYGDEATQGSWPEIEAALLEQAQIAARAGYSIVIDATNANGDHRRDLITKLRAVAPGYWAGWWVMTPVDVCLKRNKARDRQVPEEVIVAMAARLEQDPPCLEDGLDELVKANSRHFLPQVFAHFAHPVGCGCIDCWDYWS